MNEDDIDDLALAIARELQKQRRSQSEIPESERPDPGEHHGESDFDA